MDNSLKVKGITVGFLMYFAYVFIFSVAGTLIAEKYFSAHLIYIAGLPLQWLVIGTVPLFITIGLYFFKCAEIWGIKGLFTGFIICLFIFVALQVLNIHPDDFGIYPEIAGLILMAGFYYLFRNNLSKK